MICDFRYDHDPVTDRPRGVCCGKTATHVILWEDGRYSRACADHLEIDDAATVKPAAIVELPAVIVVVR